MTNQFLWFQVQKEQLQQQLEYTLLKLVNFKNAIWHFRRTIWNKIATENIWKLFRLLFDHLAWIEHQFFEWHKRFKEGRESVRDDERCGRSKEVQYTRVDWPKRLGLELLCWGFKGVQEEIPREEDSTLQNRVSGHFHQDNVPVHNSILITGLFDQDGHQDTSSLSL